MIVESDADIRVTARRIAWGKWLNCGQTCISPDYVLCADSVKKEFTNALVASIYDFYSKKIKNSPDYSRIINTKNYEYIFEFLQ